MDRRDKTNYYLDMAQVALERGTCLRRNFGAVIVKNDVIVSTGYNGAPRGRANCIDIGTCIRQKMGIPRGERYEFCRSVCLLARQFFDHQRLQRQHREQEDQIAGKAEPAQNRKDDVGGNKRQRAQPHPQIKVVLFPENGGNNVRTGSVKDDDDEVEDKKCNKSEQTDKNDGPVDNGMKRVGIVALRKIRGIFQFINSGLIALDDIKCPSGQIQPFF